MTPAHLEALTLGEIAALVKRFSQVDYGLRHSSYGHLPLELCLVDSILARGADDVAAPAQRQAPAAPRALPTRPTAVPTARPPQAEEAPPAVPERAPTPLRPVVATPPAPAPVQVAAQSGDDDWSASLMSDAPAPSLTPAAAPVTPTPAPATPAPARISIEEVHGHWSRIRQMVRASSRRIEALLASADPLLIDAETLTLVAAYDFHRDGLNKDDTRKVIEEVIAQVLGNPYRLHCVNQEEARAMPAASFAPPAPAPEVAAPPPPVPVAPPQRRTKSHHPGRSRPRRKPRRRSAWHRAREQHSPPRRNLWPPLARRLTISARVRRPPRPSRSMSGTSTPSRICSTPWKSNPMARPRRVRVGATERTPPRGRAATVGVTIAAALPN